jgi:hypothetical protein
MCSPGDLQRFIQALASNAFGAPKVIWQAMPLAVKNGKTLILPGRAFSHFPLDGATSPYPFD